MNSRPYYQYLMDYMKEYREDEVQYMKEDEIDDYLEGKEEVYKENYFLRDNFQIPYFREKLAKERVRDSIIDFTGSFIDKHATQLSTSGPVHIFTFGEKETSFLYNTFGLREDQMEDFFNRMIDETYNGKISAFIKGWFHRAPHKMMLVAIAIESSQSGYDDILTCDKYFWAFTEYPILYRNYWKTGVKEDVMNYTIEHLSSKNIVTQVKNLQELLNYDTTRVFTLCKDELIKGADNIYVDLTYKMRNQMNSKMKNIAIAYYKNSEENNSQHNNVTQFDDGEFADMEGHSTNLSQAVDKIIGKFMSGEINATMVRIAAEGNKVDRDNLYGYLSQIYSTKNNNMPKMVENIITSYFSKNPTDSSLGSGEFLNYGLALYRSIGTSKDKLLVEIKEILHRWMNDIINIKEQYQRPATIINYSRAVFNYIILMINYYN